MAYRKLPFSRRRSAATKIQSAFRGMVGRRMARNKRQARARFSIRQIGFKRGYGNSKSKQLLPGAVTVVNQRTLNTQGLIRIAKGQNNNERERDRIFLKGWDMKFMCVNRMQVPVCLNIAVITPKTSKNVVSTGFFRSADINNRQVDFDRTLLTSQEMNYKHINSDDYIVHWRKKVFLAPYVNAGRDGAVIYGSYTNNKGSNWKSIQKYMRVNRQIRFEGDGFTDAEEQPTLVWWFDAIEEETLSSTAGSITFNPKIVAYFNEPKS